MTTYPTRFTVGVMTYTEGAVDDFGDPEDVWSTPAEVPVYGWAPAATGEPFEANRDVVTWDLDLYAPSGFTVGPRDRVVVLGVEYEVEGVVESFDFGPFGFTPGCRVRLKRVEG